MVPEKGVSSGERDMEQTDHLFLTSPDSGHSRPREIWAETSLLSSKAPDADTQEHFKLAKKENGPFFRISITLELPGQFLSSVIVSLHPEEIILTAIRKLGATQVGFCKSGGVVGCICWYTPLGCLFESTPQCFHGFICITVRKRM